MTPDELAALRDREIAMLHALRSACIPHLFNPDERYRRHASASLRRVDAQILRLGGTCEEMPPEGGQMYLLPRKVR